MGLFGKLFKSPNEKQIDRLEKIANEIEAVAGRYLEMSDDELKSQTAIFKQRLANGETLDDILVEAFAVAREASARVLNMRHFHVQLLGGISLHQGRIAQMSTGEGKTLVATLPAYLNALAGTGMHIVTVNDYLARRDAEWMGKVYKYLGLTVAVVVSGMNGEQKRQAYNSDIIYATNNELGFDYLRDNMAVDKSQRLQRQLTFAIIDEVDSILIDEARTPLIISGGSGKSSELYSIANRFAKTLVGDHEVEEINQDGEIEKVTKSDYIIEEKEKTVRLSEDGVAKAEQFFKLDNLSDIENEEIVHHINNALRARVTMNRDTDYVVSDGEVIIVDEFTGRTMVGRRYSDGLHQAIEAKEGVRVQGESKTLATITFQNFFRLYTKLSGMTGTAKTEEEEFRDIYKLDVVVLPTNVPIARVDENDKLYKSIKGKMKAIIEDISQSHAKKQPVLVGTPTVEKSEELSALLKSAKIPHNVLNAKNHASEAEIVAQAGKLGQVTIATNMAGRGTDIVLGGNPDFLAKQKLIKLGYSTEIIAEATSYANITDEKILEAKAEYEKYYKLFKIETDAERQQVVAAGGLRILGTSRHDSRRIDDQLRGRAGRQGDPGASLFYLSMEDDLVRVFGGDSMKIVADRLNLDENQAIEVKILTNQIEKAQQRIESRDFSIRKTVLAYDDVMNKQRNIIYRERAKVLDGIDISDQVEKMIIDQAERIVFSYVDYDEDYREWDYEAFNNALEAVVLKVGTDILDIQLASCRDENKIRDAVVDEALKQFFAKKKDVIDSGIDFENVQRTVLLKVVDSKWIEHLENMQQLKNGIGLMAYGQKDPVVAYRNLGADMFNEMTEGIARHTVELLVKANFEREVTRKQVGVETGNSANPKVSTVTREGDKVGRNDSCPCGSGRKYKNCCGV